MRHYPFRSRPNALLLTMLLLAVSTRLAFAEGVATAKLSANGTNVSLNGVIVSYVEPDLFYVQEEDGNTGIMVRSVGNHVTTGSKMDIEGRVLTADNGERYVGPTSINWRGKGVARSTAMTTLLRSEAGGHHSARICTR